MFGDSDLGLEGSARRNKAIDELQFGHVRADGSLDVGIISDSMEFERAARDIARVYGPGGASPGPYQGKLDAVAPLQHLFAASSGNAANNIAAAVELYLADSETTSDGILTTNLIISSVHICLVCLLYLIVFRRMVEVLVRQAARSEAMLLALPEEMATTGKLQKYFVRVTTS